MGSEREQYSRFSDNLKKAMELATQAAVEADLRYVGSEHLLYGFMRLPRCSAYRVLVSAVNSTEFYNVICQFGDKKTVSDGFFPAEISRRKAKPVFRLFPVYSR